LFIRVGDRIVNKVDVWGCNASGWVIGE